MKLTFVFSAGETETCDRLVSARATLGQQWQGFLRVDARSTFNSHPAHSSMRLLLHGQAPCIPPGQALSFFISSAEGRREEEKRRGDCQNPGVHANRMEEIAQSIEEAERRAQCGVGSGPGRVFMQNVHITLGTARPANLTLVHQRPSHRPCK